MDESATEKPGILKSELGCRVKRTDEGRSASSGGWMGDCEADMSCQHCVHEANGLHLKGNGISHIKGVLEEHAC